MDTNLPTDDVSQTSQGQTNTQKITTNKRGQDQDTTSQLPKKMSYQVQQPSGLKEQKEAFGAPFAEGIKIVEKKEFEPSEELAGWMEKVEGEEITLPQPIRDEYGQILVRAATITKPKIVLPLTKKKVKKGLHHKVADSLRWLAEWCLRLLKMFPERVVYKKAAMKKAGQAT